MACITQTWGIFGKSLEFGTSDEITYFSANKKLHNAKNEIKLVGCFRREGINKNVNSINPDPAMERAANDPKTR